MASHHEDVFYNVLIACAGNSFATQVYREFLLHTHTTFYLILRGTNSKVKKHIRRARQRQRGEPGLVAIAELVQVGRHVTNVLEGVDDDVVDGVAPIEDVRPRAQRLPLVRRAQPPRLQDVLMHNPPRQTHTPAIPEIFFYYMK